MNFKAEMVHIHLFLLRASKVSITRKPVLQNKHLTEIPFMTFTGFLLAISHISLAHDRAVLSEKRNIKNNTITLYAFGLVIAT